MLSDMKLPSKILIIRHQTRLVYDKYKNQPELTLKKVANFAIQTWVCSVSFKASFTTPKPYQRSKSVSAASLTNRILFDGTKIHNNA